MRTVIREWKYVRSFQCRQRVLPGYCALSLVCIDNQGAKRSLSESRLLQEGSAKSFEGLISHADISTTCCYFEIGHQAGTIRLCILVGFAHHDAAMKSRASVDPSLLREIKHICQHCTADIRIERCGFTTMAGDQVSEFS